MFHCSSFIAPVMAQERGFVHPGGLHTQAYFPFYIDQAVGTHLLAIHTSTSSTAPKFLDVSEGVMEVTADKTIVHFPFELISVDNVDGISLPPSDSSYGEDAGTMYDLSGRKIVKSSNRSFYRGLPMQKGVHVVKGGKIIVR